ncbi:MAG: alpha/beta fold hydrolase [Proteobacteria bacterium]|nr:alpha/beta fold hydrolase [Pseudomonadota bacterium]
MNVGPSTQFDTVQPLVLLHGFTGSPASWDAVLDNLPADITAVRLALPGHDPSVAVARNWADNIEYIADQIALAPAHVCGYSLGARTALALAVQHPERVARLTLIGVHPGLSSDRERAERRISDGKWIDLLRDQGIEAFVAAWQAQPIFASQAALDPETRRRQQQIRSSHDPLALAASLECMGLSQMPDYRLPLAKLPMPVTLVTGERDHKFTALARQVSVGHAITTTTIGDCGHNAVIERPQAIASLLASSASESDGRVE